MWPLPPLANYKEVNYLDTDTSRIIPISASITLRNTGDVLLTGSLELFNFDYTLFTDNNNGNTFSMGSVKFIDVNPRHQKGKFDMKPYIEPGNNLIEIRGGKKTKKSRKMRKSKKTKKTRKNRKVMRKSKKSKK